MRRTMLRMSRVARRAARIVALLVTVSIGLYLSLRLYLSYEAHRMSQMLTMLNGINIGDTEESALSAVERYGGYRWSQPDKARGAYEYVVEVDPWYFGNMTGHRQRFEGIGTRVVSVINANPSLRRAVGLRMWRTTGSIDINQGRVEGVSAEVLVEGRDEWLGGSWSLAPTIPDYVLQEYSSVKQPWPELNRYVVGWTHLHVGSGTGEGVNMWITPSATDSESRAARRVNTSCLTSRTGCWALCSLVPDAARYHKDHPDAGWGGNWGEAERTCP
jgi:hypothetical protein